MQPALNPDLRYPDYVFLNRWAIRNQNIQHGDIVCVISPKVPNQTLIKRVIGLAGDIVDTRGYKLSVLEVWISFVYVQICVYCVITNIYTITTLLECRYQKDTAG